MDKAPEQAPLDEGLADFHKHAAVIDAYLQNRNWLVGDRLSYADFRAASALPFADQAGIPLSEFPNMLRWHNQLMEIEAWRTPFVNI